MEHLHKQGIGAVFHYVPLHSSPMGRRLGGDARELPVTDSASGGLGRLPFYYTITDEEQAEVVGQIAAFFGATRRVRVRPGLTRAGRRLHRWAVDFMNFGTQEIRVAPAGSRQRPI